MSAQSASATGPTHDNLNPGPATKPQDTAGHQHSNQPAQRTLDVHAVQALSIDAEHPKRLDWTEIDFPPLSEMKGDRRVENSVWAEKRTSKDIEE
jgi:hypothetical protein